MTDKVQKMREEVVRLKSQLLRGACSSQVTMETRCKEEAYNEVLTILDSMQEECKPKYFNVEKGKLYICIRDYHDKNCTFTKGKTYQSDMDGFLVDDEDRCTFERKIWEEDACEYFRPAMQEE